MIRKKSLNDISSQFDRCCNLNRENSEDGKENRIYAIIWAALSARELRKLSVFDADRNIKK